MAESPLAEVIRSCPFAFGDATDIGGGRYDVSREMPPPVRQIMKNGVLLEPFDISSLAPPPPTIVKKRRP